MADELRLAQKITPPRWMRNAQSLAVMAALGADQARFVGGCVRNVLLGREVSDIDIASVHVPDVVMERLRGIGAKVIPTGLDHGTVTAIYDGEKYEITTLRFDKKTDGRHAVVQFSTSWVEDARRRDFTMNTLLADCDGNIYDPTGEGIDDLNAGHVRFVGDAEQRITEDYLRILRFFRFYAIYGQGAADADALRACAQHADKLSTLSRERITQEFLKIIGCDAAVEVLKLMCDCKVLDGIFDAVDWDMFARFCDLQKRCGGDDVAARLYALSGAARDIDAYYAPFLILKNAFKHHVKRIDDALNYKGDAGINHIKSAQQVKELMYYYGRDVTRQSLLIMTARGEIDVGVLDAHLQLARAWDIPTFPVTGDDLIREGIAQGPELGEALKCREQAWVKGGFLFSKVL